jgi:translation elongation factor EF-Ts
VHQGLIGVLIELGTETSLVKSGGRFLELAQDLAMHIAAADPPSVEQLLDYSFI